MPKEKNNNGGTPSHLSGIVVITIFIISIILDIVSVFLLKNHLAFSIIFIALTSSAIASLGIKYKNDVKDFRNICGLSKAIVIIFLIAVFFDAFAVFIIPFRKDIFLPKQEEYYDFSEINIKEMDVFFQQESNQLEFEQKLKSSLLHVQKVSTHSPEYLDVLNGYGDVAPFAQAAEEMMLNIIKTRTINLVDEETRESIRTSVHEKRAAMDAVEHTVSNRNSMFENALSMANSGFTKNFREDYCIAACDVWGRLYTSIGTGAFCEKDIDHVIRVYKDMLDSEEFFKDDEFSDKRQSIQLIIDTLTLLKCDDDFIDELENYSKEISKIEYVKD